MHQRQFLLDDSFNLCRGFQAVFRQIKADIFTHRQRVEQTSALEHHRQAEPITDAFVFDTRVVEQNLARIGRLESDQMAQQHRFPGTTRTH